MESATSQTLPRSHYQIRPGVRIREPGEEGRPLSLYDNLNGAGGGGGGDGVGGDEEEGGVNSSNAPPPSMAPHMVTTVPQNIAAPKIEGRHTPTRSSLRHSRMIVMSKQGKVPRKYLPHVLRQHKLAKSLLALQLLMGIAVSTLAGWLLLWAPSLPTRDIPYWSGSLILLSAIIGLILICSCRKEYPGMPLACYVFTFKVISVLASIAAAIACFSASTFAILHLVRLYSLECEPANVLNASCVCRRDSIPLLTYPDLNCPEVWNVLSVLLIGSAAANAIAGLLSSWYVYLHWVSRYGYLYSRVRTNDNRPIIITNKM